MSFRVGSREREFAMPGGVAHRGQVVRVGDTVRRPQNPGSRAIHALLEYLHDAGFDGAPRYLGDDEHGREVLSYVQGEVPRTPFPAWALTASALTSVARLLRRYHEAVAGFPLYGPWDTVAPAEFGHDIVSHNDPNLDNVVFRDGEAVALIDFDWACPGSALWDVALAARLWTPLRAPEDSDDLRRGSEFVRFRAFVDAYGSPAMDPELLVRAVVLCNGWAYDIVRAGAESGHVGYKDFWEVARHRSSRTEQWLHRNEQALLAALQ